MSSHVIKRILTNSGTLPGKAIAVPELKLLIEAMRSIPIESKLLRVSPDGDGGYLVPDDLAGINFCFSLGVAYCSDFELDMANRGMHVFLADKSVAGIIPGNAPMCGEYSVALSKVTFSSGPAT